MDEDSYVSDNSLKITAEYLRLGGRKYHLDDLASVSIRATQNDPLRDLPTLLVVLGSILMFTLINFQPILPTAWEDTMRIGGLVGILISVAGLLILIVNNVLKSESLYMVQLKGSFGTSYPLASDNKAFVQSIVISIQHALDTQPEQLPRPHPTITHNAYHN